MISLIENEVVEKHQWLSAEQFTDILAISQTTPGPIGINTATYVGYTASFDAGYGGFGAVLGACVASFAVILLPFVLMMVVVRFLAVHRGNPIIMDVFRTLRITVLGLIAAAALSLLTEDSFGLPGWNRRFVVSCLIFAAVFVLSVVPDKNIKIHNLKFTFHFSTRPGPIKLLIAAALLGLLIYH